jgi:Zn-dependent protease with chaperone function
MTTTHAVLIGLALWLLPAVLLALVMLVVLRFARDRPARAPSVALASPQARWSAMT